MPALVATAAGFLSLACAAGLEQLSAQNRGKMFMLEQGQTRDQVMAIMGTDSTEVAKGVFRTGKIANPYCSETHEVNGYDWEILYYATNVRNTDGALTEEELTPVVLKDGLLDGWGWNYFRHLSQEYDIQRTGPVPPGQEGEGGG
jgi:hypothetical protein